MRAYFSGFRPRRYGKGKAFTLVELLVSMVILLLIAVAVFSITNATGKVWKTTGNKISAFQAARTAFESMTRQLSQATLNTYWDYFDSNDNVVNGSNTNPIDRYGRNSELHFISGQAATLITEPKTWSGSSPAVRPAHAIFFVTPMGIVTPPASNTAPNLEGLDKLLNASGYYVEFNSDAVDRPKFLQANTASARHRYRLMQVTQPSERLGIYNTNWLASAGWPKYNGWFNDAIASRGADGIVANEVRPIADNIIALIVLPKRSSADGGNLAPNYQYDSRTTVSSKTVQRHQLPPIVQITMVALDESSAIQLAMQNGTNAPDLVPSSSFTNASDYSSGDPSDPKDMETLQSALSDKRLSYRVFTTDVLIRGAKWSED